ncbi:hypothetical protein [Dehalobacter sp. 14DCB1]|uniref:hypothetical protein n=1 Tax=Dehalobacter sp. 14DCB1 TaxID=2070227 RepID=UPI00104DE7A5|nr:hypothetical protein [Dehalobacter sp. 14DCB1]TCX53814.1 hypothetical protein C1I36_03530 [Dehalobacter sp. 14DCB1]
MNLLQTLENDIKKADYRMAAIRIEQKVLEKEYDLTNEKKWELEAYRDALIAEQTERQDGGAGDEI